MERWKNLSRKKKIIIIVLGFFFVTGLFSSKETRAPEKKTEVAKVEPIVTRLPTPTETPAQIAEKKKNERDKSIRLQFSAWDGSHYNLEKHIKKNMNDPDSYKHVETRYVDLETYLIVTTTFRGKNGFGGVVTNNITAKVDMNGNILEVVK
jgi:hypothetical protein